MHHRLTSLGWVLLLGITFPTVAWGIEWLPRNTIGPASGGVVTWTSAASTADSGVLTCQGDCLCDNTHATTNATIYRAKKAGTKNPGDWWKAPANVDCSDTALAQCSTVELSAGSYIFVPDSAAVVTFECRAKLTGGP